MFESKTGRRMVPTILLAAGLGILLGRVAAQTPPALTLEDPFNRGLDANLYMQTSAEYRAACFQAYNLADLRLKQALAKSPGVANPAVIMDLDETVLDNAGFQSQQLRGNFAWAQATWDAWERSGADVVGLIPGARDFILEATRAKVTVIYISNRGDKSRPYTRKALERLGLPPVEDKNLKLATTTSDKTQRRLDAAGEYTILLNVGDNLRDFDDKYKTPALDKKVPATIEAAIKARKDRVDDERPGWGDKWIILPNPAYGEWTRPLGLGIGDLDRLAPPVGEKK